MVKKRNSKLAEQLLYLTLDHLEDLFNDVLEDVRSQLLNKNKNSRVQENLQELGVPDILRVPSVPVTLTTPTTSSTSSTSRTKEDTVLQRPKRITPVIKKVAVTEEDAPITEKGKSKLKMRLPKISKPVLMEEDDEF